MAEWYDEVLAQDPLDPDAAAARDNARAAAGNEEEFGKAVERGRMRSTAFGTWLANLPRNIAVGSYKAALNVIEFGVDVVDAMAQGGQAAERREIGEKTGAAPETPAPTSVREQFPDFFENAHAFADDLTAQNTLGDDITQGIVQFALPFAGYLKLAGGLSTGSTMVKIGRAVAAESAVAGTAFDPQEGRLADLAQLGQQAENRFGDLLRKVAPDGSLVNSYIEWMTNRDEEGSWEGRFKNAVDSVAGTAVFASMLKGAATGFKLAKQIAIDAPKVGAAAQRGQIGVSNARSGRILELTDEGRGEYRVVMRGVGESQLVETGPYLQQKRIDVQEHARGTGAGMELILRGVQEAEKRGLVFASDFSVSPSAARLYHGLERRGYVVKRNPSNVNPNTGNLVSEDPRVPVFEVTKAAQE